MSMGFFSQLRRLRVEIVRVGRLEPLFSTSKGVSFPPDIMALFLGVLVVWPGSALAPSLLWLPVALMTLVLGLVTPSTLRLTLYFLPIEHDSETPPSI
jgi:hypothetical protein